MCCEPGTAGGQDPQASKVPRGSGQSECVGGRGLTEASLTLSEFFIQLELSVVTKVCNPDIVEAGGSGVQD